MCYYICDTINNNNMENLDATTRELLFCKIEELKEEKINLTERIEKGGIEFRLIHQIELDILIGSIETMKKTLFANFHTFEN